jgi:hypothetical protein
MAGLTLVNSVVRKKKPGGKRSSVQHAAGIVGFDQALDRDGEIGERSLGQHMDGVAEGVLAHVEAGVGGNVDLPVSDILPVMAAGRHPQNLGDAGGRRFVAIGG